MIDHAAVPNPYLGLALGVLFLLYIVLIKRHIPNYMRIIVVFLAATGAVMGIDLGYAAITLPADQLGDLANHRVEIILGAMAVMWTTLETLYRTLINSKFELRIKEPADKS
ncbi:MAG: hypothetical protein ABW166_14620 [Sedimenticola sp.]